MFCTIRSFCEKPCTSSAFLLICVGDDCLRVVGSRVNDLKQWASVFSATCVTVLVNRLTSLHKKQRILGNLCGLRSQTV